MNSFDLNAAKAIQSTVGYNANQKLCKLQNQRIGNYILLGHEYYPSDSYLRLYLNRVRDGAVIRRHLSAPITIFNLDDDIFVNHLEDVMNSLDRKTA